MEKITKLRQALKNDNIDGFIVPTSDEFLGEYTPEHLRRLEFLTGFTGSNGILVITLDKLYFFTDGRYLLQARNELNKCYEIYDIAGICDWLKDHFPKGLKIGFDPKIHSIKFISHIEKIAKQRDVKLIPTNNLVDVIWTENRVFPKSEIWIHDVKYTGLSYVDKVKQISTILKKKKATAFIITAPESVCWLLNIRGSDVPYTPFVNCYAILYADGFVTLYLNDYESKDNLQAYFGDIVRVKKIKELEAELQNLDRISSNIMIDQNYASYWFKGNFSKANIAFTEDPCIELKSCKNKIEQEWAIEAHIQDAIAVTELLYKLKYEKGYSELSVAELALKLRQARDNFVFPSFATIAGFNENGAIIHYHANDKTNKIIDGDGILLIDSGGQYHSGTTDITRTIAIGRPTKEQIRNYTLVLKGHIALSSAKFPIGTTGSALDSIARQYLWQDGKDYAHGTGHGVGSFLSVHEGPQRISKVPSHVALKKGMILSNEPGYYKEGEYGIRIENLIMVQKSKINNDFLEFKNLTLVPYEIDLIDKNMLTYNEVDFVNNYHKEIYKKLQNNLSKEILEWVKREL